MATQSKTPKKPTTPTGPPMLPEGKATAIGATTATVHTVGKTVTLRLKRHLKAPPEKVYKAFLDADVLAAWLPPHGFVATTHHLEPKVGGTFRMSFHTVTKSWSHTFGGKYLELVPGKKIVHTDAFETDDPNMKGEMRVTITLTAKDGGTLLEVEQAGIPAPVAGGSPYGWSQSLDKLAQLVEPELPF